MPDCFGVPVVTNSCAFYAAHEAAGVPDTRHSLRPPIFEDAFLSNDSGAIVPRDGFRARVTSELHPVPRAPEQRFDSPRQMRFPANQAIVSPRGPRSLQETGHWRPRRDYSMSRPPWLLHLGRRSGNGSARAFFHGPDDDGRGGSRGQHRVDHADLRISISARRVERGGLSRLAKLRPPGLNIRSYPGYGRSFRNTFRRSY